MFRTLSFHALSLLTVRELPDCLDHSLILETNLWMCRLCTCVSDLPLSTLLVPTVWMRSKVLNPQIVWWDKFSIGQNLCCLMIIFPWFIHSNILELGAETLHHDSRDWRGDQGIIQFWTDAPHATLTTLNGAKTGGLKLWPTSLINPWLDRCLVRSPVTSTLRDF